MSSPRHIEVAGDDRHIDVEGEERQMEVEGETVFVIVSDTVRNGEEGRKGEVVRVLTFSLTVSLCDSLMDSLRLMDSRRKIGACCVTVTISVSVNAGATTSIVVINDSLRHAGV
jgi:hypothetical protein